MFAEFGPQFRVALGNRGAPPRAAGSAPPSHDSAAWRSDLLLVPHDNRTFQLFWRIIDALDMMHLQLLSDRVSYSRSFSDGSFRTSRFLLFACGLLHVLFGNV